MLSLVSVTKYCPFLNPYTTSLKFQLLQQPSLLLDSSQYQVRLSLATS